jgi:hypothetical protein
VAGSLPVAVKELAVRGECWEALWQLGEFRVVPVPKDLVDDEVRLPRLATAWPAMSLEYLMTSSIVF